MTSAGVEPAGLSKEVGRALTAFARAARAKHLYLSNNVALRRSVSDAMALFSELLGKTEEVSLRVRPDAFLFDDERVLEEPNPDESIAFAFFRDGIRRLDFSRGLTQAELEVLVQATANGFTFSGLGDDIVSYLWRHDLSHVHYVVVDTTIVDALAGSDGPAPSGQPVDLDAQIDGLLTAIYGGGTEDVGPRSVHVDASDVAAQLIAEQLEGDEDVGGRFHPVRQLGRSSTYAGELLFELEQEDEGAIDLRLLYAALEGLALGDNHQDHAAIGRGLMDLYDAKLVGNDLLGATQIVSALRGLGDLEAAAGRVTMLLQEATTEARLRQAASSLAVKTPEGQQALAGLFSAAGPVVVPALLALLPGFSDPAARHYFAEVALEIGIHDLEPLRRLLASDQTYVVEEAVELLTSVGTPEALKLLLTVRDHPEATVRARIMGAVPGLPRGDALEAAAMGMADPEPTVAAAAAAALQQIGGEGALAAIDAAARAQDVLLRPLEVQVALLDAHAGLFGARSLPLLARYLTKGENRSAQAGEESLAIAAARALRLVGTPGAVMALKTAAGYWNKAVREEARQVILRLREASE